MTQNNVAVVDPAAPALAERPMRVLHVGKYYPPAPGGMETVVRLLCEHERPITDSRVLVSNTSATTISESWRGVPVTRVARLAAIGSVGVCPTFPIEWARQQTDVTVLHEPNPIALISDLLTWQRGPLVVWYHSEVMRAAWKYKLMYEPFLKRVLDRASRIVVSSPKLTEHAAALQPYRDKCLVVPFGIELAKLAPTPAVAARARALRQEHGRPIVLFVGRLVPYKGAAILIDAVRGLDVTTIVVGSGPLGPALRTQAAQSGASVVFAGEVDAQELLALYHACDLFVLPSVTRAEAFGMVQLEAMACGKPVISTDLPSGVPWVNRHGESGLVVPPENADALARAIRDLLEDHALRERLGAGARRRVEQEFTAGLMAARTVALYREVLNADAA
jgi:glycosyltransferase involved in cell wall biosynthesis